VPQEAIATIPERLQDLPQLLARMEGQLMLAALAAKVKTIELTAEPKRGFNNTLRSLATLPVRMTAH